MSSMVSGLSTRPVGPLRMGNVTSEKAINMTSRPEGGGGVGGRIMRESQINKVYYFQKIAAMGFQ